MDYEINLEEANYVCRRQMEYFPNIGLGKNFMNRLEKH